MKLFLNIRSDNLINTITRTVEVDKNNVELACDVLRDMVDTLKKFDREEELKVEAQRLTQHND